MWLRKLTLLLCSVFIVAAQDDCGVGKEHVTTVYRGQEVEKGDWPWLSAIFRKNGRGFDFNSAGTLVSKSHVITVAHSLYKFPGQRIQTQELLIYFGKHYLFVGQDQDHVQNRAISEQFVHPQYNHSSFLKINDIAILVLESPVSFTQFIKPVCLWEAGEDPLEGSDTGTAVGWGVTNDPTITKEKISDVPHAVRMPVVSNDECLQSLSYFNTSGIVNNKTICAGKRDGSGTCTGDNGGGLYVFREGRWVLRGLIRKSLVNRKTGGCNLHHYAVMTDVYKYIPWLYKTIGVGQFNLTTPRTAVLRDPIIQDDCGVGNGHVTTVYRGQEVNKGDWPWLSAIFRKTGRGFDFTCAGSLVSASHVVTAAHCLYTTLNGITRQVRTQNLLLYFGKHHLFSGQDDNQVQFRSISERFLHPQYNHSSSSKKHDIAILVLESPVSFTQFIKPVCLRQAGADPLQGSDTGIAVGWGATDDQDIEVKLSEVPRKVRMPVVSNDVCLQSLEYFRTSGLVTNGTICAGKRDGSGTCSGDSGGGLFVLRENRWVLRGVISKSLKNQNTGGCNLHQFAVMTDVYKYIPWLNRTIGVGQIKFTSPASTVLRHPTVQGTELIGHLRYVIENNEKLNWFAAREKCRAKSMDLFSPAPLEEYNTVLDYIINKYGTERDYWIGGNDLGKEGNFVWASTGVTLSFSFWLPGEPNNSGGGKEEDCVTMVPRERGWNDEVCSEIVHNYICS